MADDGALARYLEGIAEEAGRGGDLSDAVESARGRDPGAGERLVAALLPLAADAALRHRPPWMAPLDAVQEANIVLVRAVESGEVDGLDARLPSLVQAHLAGLAPPG